MLFKKFAVAVAIATTLAFVGCTKNEATEAASEATEAVDAVDATTEVAASEVAASAAQ